MKLIINEDRSVIPVGTWGTVNENDYEILEFEFPAELEEYNKRIVYYLGDEKVWDTIVNNKAYITNAITTKGDVKAYVWCTKENTEREADTDFRTMLFEMHFYENENADGIVPTEEQVDGFNTMLTAMNAKIDEVDALEQTIETAEAQRQEAEATRVSNENTRESNESTRESNEQTRQEQEAERERRTDEAIGNIEDKTAEYNANAEAKTTAFNNNATQKTNDFNSNYTQKVNDFNTNASSKETAFNSNASSKTSDFNSNAETKTNAFNTNATNKTNDFDNNATEKTSEFNTNAESKTSAFNDNATQKTTNFDNNASEKTDEFNTNAQNKIDEYDEHIVEYQAQIDELQNEVEELSENMPWNITEQATEISVDDAAKYSRNKLKLFGNTEQIQYTGKNLLDTSANNTTLFAYFDGQTGEVINDTTKSNCIFNEYIEVKPDTSYTISSKEVTNYTIYGVAEYNESKEFIQALSTGNTHPLAYTFTTTENTKYIRARYKWTANTEITNDIIEDKRIQLEEGQATDYEPYTNGPSPNPNYPQNIHVVTGDNTIGVQGKNLANLSILDNVPSINNGNLVYYKGGACTDFIEIDNTKNYYFSFSQYQGTTKYALFYDANKTYLGYSTIDNTYNLRNYANYSQSKYVRLRVDVLSRIEYVQLEQGSTATSYEQYHLEEYPLNLGSLELCKIRDYQDYLYKENGNWYKYGAITKIILDGTENWKKSGLYNGSYYIDKGTSSKFYIVTAFSPLLCSHFIRANINYAAQISNYKQGDCFVENTQGNFNVWYDDGTIALNDFKTWLSENNLVVYCVLKSPTTTQITDETLISQLEAIYNHLALVKGTNHITITPSDLEPYVTLNYMQDLPSKLDNLDSRLSLLE